MACAGIVAASHTTESPPVPDKNTGVISMNPYVNILPIKISTNAGHAPPISAYADAFGWAWYEGEADILSNSWGFRRHGPFWDTLPPGHFRWESIG